MDITLDILIDQLQREWVVSTLRSEGEEGTAFTNVQLVDDKDIPFDEHTLYVIDHECLNKDPELLKRIRTLCVSIPKIVDAGATETSPYKGSTLIYVEAPNESALLNRIVTFFLKIQRWENAIDGIISQNRSMQELLDTSQDILGLPIATCGPFFDSFEFTSKLRSTDPFFIEITENRRLSSQSIDKLKQADVFGTLSEDRHVKVFAPSEIIPIWHMNRHFRERGERVFFVTAMCDDGMPTSGTIEIFEFFSMKLYELHRNQSKLEGTDQKIQELILRRLLFAEDISNDNIIGMFDKVGMHTTGLWQLAIIQFKDPSSFPKTYNANLFSERHMETLSCVVDYQIIVLSKSGHFNSKMLDELISLAEQNDGNVGLSSQIDNISDTSSAYKQAQFAIRIGTRISEEKILKRAFDIDKAYPERCYCFDDYLIHELLDHYPLGTRGLNPGRRPAFALAEHDKLNNTHKTRFLYTYLDCNCSVSRTAQALGVHRNSVNYQIKTIESILDVKIDDVDFICHTLLAFASMEVFGI